MKKPQIKKAKKKLPDLTKIPEELLEREMGRRARIRRQKEADKTIKKMHKLYRTRASCPILGKAYLPDGFSVSYWHGLDILKTIEIASIHFGDSRGNKHSEVKMKVSAPTYKVIKVMIGDWDKLIKEFWIETREKFEDLVIGLVKDPARIAIMVAETADNFSINPDDSSELEVEYYNKIIKLFNKSVFERFKEYTDDVLIDALKRINSGEARPGSFGNSNDAADMLMSVLRHRGHTYKLNSEKWAEYEEASESPDFDDENYDWEDDED